MTKRILIVDDEADCVELLTQVLGDTYEVKGASDGQQALALVHSFTPDLVITDLSLPGLSGVELARRVRGSAATAFTFLVAFTGSGELPASELALFDRLVQKPVRIRLLEEVVGQLLRHAVAT
jgi:two-component system CheB/CheR fusion protein